MAKRPTTRARTTTTRGKPRAAPLPGLEDHAIKPLEDVAARYAEIRDQRMELTQSEHTLKLHALKLMKKYDKTIYRHDGIEITVVPGEDEVKVKVHKPTDDDEEETAPAAGAEFAADRRAAVDTED